MTGTARRFGRLGLTSLIAGGAMAAASSTALAYPGVPATATVTAAAGCNAVVLGGTCSVTVHFASSEGAAIVGATVTWVVSVPPGGTVTPNPSVTDVNGNTSVTYHAPTTGVASAPSGNFLASVVHLAAVSLCAPGTITGTTGGVSVSTQVNVVCPSGANSGASGTSGNNLLPVTSTEAPGGPRAPLIGAGILAILLAIGGVARLKRSRRLTV